MLEDLRTIGIQLGRFACLALVLRRQLGQALLPVVRQLPVEHLGTRSQGAFVDASAPRFLC